MTREVGDDDKDDDEISPKRKALADLWTRTTTWRPDLMISGEGTVPRLRRRHCDAKERSNALCSVGSNFIFVGDAWI